MAEMDDFDLLVEYGAPRSRNTAFAALTQRYVRVVYSAALRQVRDPRRRRRSPRWSSCCWLKKAHSFGKGAVLSAWLLAGRALYLHQSPVSQYRRVRREQQALQMQTTSTGDSSWEQIAPLLDEAMSRMGEKDRNALALRFFEQKSLEEVGWRWALTPPRHRNACGGRWTSCANTFPGMARRFPRRPSRRRYPPTPFTARPPAWPPSWRRPPRSREPPPPPQLQPSSKEL